MMHRAMPVVYGDRRKDDNHFAWVTVMLNLPGMRSYEPSKPRVYKKRKDGKIRANPHVSEIVVAKRFWEDERDSYWDFQKDVVTRKNSGT